MSAHEWARVMECANRRGIGLEYDQPRPGWRQLHIEDGSRIVTGPKGWWAHFSRAKRDRGLQTLLLYLETIPAPRSSPGRGFGLSPCGPP